MDALPSHDTLRRWLLRVLGVLAVLGQAVEVADAYWRRPRQLRPLVRFFSLSHEGNLPTWYASGLLLCCALALAVLARQASLRAEAPRAHWWGLSGAFFYMSLDEAVGLHEHLGGWELHGVLYFSWVVPGAGVVAVLGALYLPFLARLPVRPRRQFLVAGALYVAGALGLELPLGYWTERHGDANLTYALIDWAEECLELLGASLFLVALWQLLRERERG